MREQMPFSHAIARRLALAGWRGAGWYWGLAERISEGAPVARVRLAGGMTWPVDRTDWIGANMYRGLYERAELAVLTCLVRPGSTVVDVGANAGYLSAVLAGLVGPAGRVLAVEPSRRFQKTLEALAAAAPAEVVVVPTALSAVGGEAWLSTGEPGNSGSARLHWESGGEVEQVVLRTLDELVESHGIDGADLVKIDVEGHEREVLAGAERMLATAQARALLVEVSPEFGDISWVGSLLERLDDRYRAWRVGEAGALRRRPVLEPLTPAAAVAAASQYNLLLAREDLVVEETT